MSSNKRKNANYAGSVGKKLQPADQAGWFTRLFLRKTDILAQREGKWQFPYAILAFLIPLLGGILAMNARANAMAEGNSSYVFSILYSDAYYQKNKWLTPIVGALTKPKSYDRFFIQARACLTHDAFGRLGQISAPTLVIGGEQDKALGVQASCDLAEAIPNARLKIYPQWGHGVYEEAPDFNQTVLQFLLS